MDTKNKRAIAVFAHNEEKNILACLESIRQTIRIGDECYVLNNGSTDNTKRIVEEYSKENAFCRPVDIKIGDKANAWNVFCHDLNIEAGLFAFVDGDCVVLPGSLDALESCLHRNSKANAAAALPDAKVSRKFREKVLREGGVAGNLYALSAEFMGRIRSNNIFLPVGLIGEDSLVGALAYWNLNPKNSWDRQRIATCEEANFSYNRLSAFSITDIRLYYRRKIRYSLRHYQNIALRAPLKAQGLEAIPQHVDALYVASEPLLKLKWRGLDTWFDFLALNQIRTRLKNRSETSA